MKEESELEVGRESTRAVFVTVRHVCACTQHNLRQSLLVGSTLTQACHRCW